MNTIEAKRIRIVDYLRLLGHEPVKVRGGQYWYLSPLRKEDTPSFKVNDRLNEWVCLQREFPHKKPVGLVCGYI